MKIKQWILRSTSWQVQNKKFERHNIQVAVLLVANMLLEPIRMKMDCVMEYIIIIWHVLEFCKKVGGESRRDESIAC